MFPLCDEWEVETTSEKVSQNLLKNKLEDLKENLFNTIILDRPTGISVRDWKLLATIEDTESTRIKEFFQDTYKLSLRTRWCYFVKQTAAPMCQLAFWRLFVKTSKFCPTSSCKLSQDHGIITAFGPHQCWSFS